MVQARVVVEAYDKEEDSPFHLMERRLEFLGEFL